MALGVLDDNCRHLNPLSAELCQRGGVPRRNLAEEYCSASVGQEWGRHSRESERDPWRREFLAHKRLEFG